MHKILLAAALVAALPLVAESPKQPWEWSDAERIAALTDDAAAAERLRAYRASQPPAATYSVEGVASDPTAGVYDRIDGRRDPHLFFPRDLFDVLVKKAYADEFQTRRATRESMEHHRTAAGLPADFWDSLEFITTAYRNDLKDIAHYKYSRHPEAEKHAAVEAINKRMCHDRRVALLEAQERFGPKLNQFLYTAIARSLTSAVLRKIDPEELRRAMTGECR